LDTLLNLFRHFGGISATPFESILETIKKRLGLTMAPVSLTGPDMTGELCRYGKQCLSATKDVISPWKHLIERLN